MDNDVIVIGSGPAGVSAAYELLAAGRGVTMLEAGSEPYAPGGVSPVNDARDGPPVSVSSRNTSPKLRLPMASRMLTDYHATYAVQTDDFELMGSLAVGGLSNVWGAGVAEWTDEFDEWPADALSTRDWYQRIAERLGVSGPKDDALTPHLSPTIPLQAPVAVSSPCLGLLQRSGDAEEAADFLMGGVRQAVITSDREGRQACDLTGQCMTGCPREAIYSSRFDVRALQTQRSFLVRPGAIVTAIGQEGDRPFVDFVSASGGQERVYCRRVFVAAGAPASTALASQIVSTIGRAVTIQSTPVIAFALAPFRSIPHAHSGGYAQAQGAHLSWPGVPPLNQHESLFGYFFNAGSLPPSELLDRLPSLVARIGSPMLRGVWARLVIVTAFLPGRLTENSIEFEPRGPTSPPAIRVRGKVRSGSREAMPAVQAFYRRRFARLGWLLIPGSFQQAPIGSDVHYGASMPMSSEPRAAAALLATDTLGRLPVADRVHFVDGAVLPALPGKPHTFTVMANAARIAAGASALD
jgi:glycine/D-amino acid oxidase-like deaminating enzyme